jgi:2-dehydro-3-deoxyphosphogluconate aldolase / (4S)-4-hydroxy-2-oxoglutarate aldolase
MRETGPAAEALEAIGGPGVVAVVRTPSPDGVLEACRALAAGGIGAVEITMTVPGALDVLAAVRSDLGEVLAVGAGTVLEVRQCRSAVAAGASFVVSPALDPAVVTACADAGVLAVPGCLTPTEVLHARRAGAGLIKLFPARVATPEYVADLLGPMPGARFLLTGGIDAARAARFVRAGAFAVGVGGSLVDPAAVRARDAGSLERRARQLVTAVAAARFLSAAGP